jgi:hypothetical protein
VLAPGRAHYSVPLTFVCARNSRSLSARPELPQPFHTFPLATAGATGAAADQPAAAVSAITPATASAVTTAAAAPAAPAASSAIHATRAAALAAAAALPLIPLIPLITGDITGDDYGDAWKCGNSVCGLDGVNDGVAARPDDL